MGNLGTWLANIIEHPAFTLFGILFGGVFLCFKYEELLQFAEMGPESKLFPCEQQGTRL